MLERVGNVAMRRIVEPTRPRSKTQPWGSEIKRMGSVPKRVGSRTNSWGSKKRRALGAYLYF